MTAKLASWQLSVFSWYVSTHFLVTCDVLQLWPRSALKKKKMYSIDYKLRPPMASGNRCVIATHLCIVPLAIIVKLLLHYWTLHFPAHINSLKCSGVMIVIHSRPQWFIILVASKIIQLFPVRGTCMMSMHTQKQLLRVYFELHFFNSSTPLNAIFSTKMR